jgi:hypothetical protein
VGGLRRGDKTLRTPAFRALVDVMHKARLFLLDARKPHLPTAFDAEGLLGERRRCGLAFHDGNFNSVAFGELCRVEPRRSNHAMRRQKAPLLVILAQ